jgi:peptide deformylase
MSLRPILTVDADMAVLKKISAPVDVIDDDLRRLMDDMLETMYAAPGIGLAAIQVGVAKRVIVMDLAKKDEPPAPRYFVNPEILSVSEETGPWEEGCLSVPDIFEDVERPLKVRLTYLDYRGDRVEEDAEELYAVCIQHEMDHLNGVLFIDHLSRLKRERAVVKVRKAARADA